MCTCACGGGIRGRREVALGRSMDWEGKTEDKRGREEMRQRTASELRTGPCRKVSALSLLGRIERDRPVYDTGLHSVEESEK